MRSSTSLPFGAVSKELATRLEAEAEGLVQHHVRAYEAHLYYQNRQELRDPRVWRRVQSNGKQGFSVYRRVRRRRDQSSAGNTTKTGLALSRLNGPAPGPQGCSNSSNSSGASAALSALSSSALPTQLLGIGFTIGTIEDMIFGSVANTTAAIKIQSLYVNDPIVDAAVLAVLMPPNGNDPLRSVTLKWILKKPKMYGVTRHRDYVFVESIGIRRSVSGERIGYHLMHSVELPSFPPLSADDAVVRRRFSSCYLYRSIGSGLIECFLRSSTDPWRSTPEPLVIHAAANRLLQCCPGFMRVAETNKLIFALQHEMRNAKDRPARRHEDPTSCHSCLKNFHMCKRGHPCQLCEQICCSRCLIVWKTSFAFSLLSEASVLEKRLRFCRSCMISAQAANPLHIAATRLC
uniref:FYVE-type domain-containing protein n=1 Tax=Globisporangium ultimum (strain ATCC 200006 / CBS 805.95 / DAOM BR144) TaxID=431595 RepID=K3WXE3_GLOUD